MATGTYTDNSYFYIPGLGQSAATGSPDGATKYTNALCATDTIVKSLVDNEHIAVTITAPLTLTGQGVGLSYNSTHFSIPASVLTIKDSAIATAQINECAVTTAKLQDSAVTTLKINDDAVTPAKIDASSAFTMGELIISVTGTLANGDWRFAIDGTDLKAYRRVGGAWVYKGAFTG